MHFQFIEMFEEETTTFWLNAKGVLRFVGNATDLINMKHEIIPSVIIISERFHTEMFSICFACHITNMEL